MAAPAFYLFAALAIVLAVTCHGKPPAPEDIGTNFFLKASKSVPRIGRRTMEYENYFLKASKSIPRIGRRTSASVTEAETVDGSFSKDSGEQPTKKSFFEKYFKENEQPVWSDLEKIYQDYPGAFQGEDPYPGAGTNPKSEAYWPRSKKNQDVVYEQSQSQSE